MSYQGVLTDAGGTPLNGNYDLTFSLYDSEIVVTPLWSESHPGVAVGSGIFSVTLGEGTPPVPLALPFDQPYWLGIRVGAGPELTPRVKLTSLAYSLGGDFWRLNGNAGTIVGTHFLGTTDNVPLELRVNGEGALRLEYAEALGTPMPNIIGGYSGNSVAAEIFGATISGGGYVDYSNTVTGHFGTIGGGYKNVASYSATVGGGYENTASGESAIVPGGTRNQADGFSSFAAGYRAKANHDGAFVWGDSTEADIASTGNDQFIVRATGGVRVYGGELVLDSSSGGLRFPDGTLQTTADIGPGSDWSLTGNAGTVPGTHFLGTTDDVPLELRANGERVLHISYVMNYPYIGTNIIGGYSGNSVGVGVVGATVFGGSAQIDDPESPNSVNGNFGAVLGGAGNTASAIRATVGGGYQRFSSAPVNKTSD